MEEKEQGSSAGAFWLSFVVTLLLLVGVLATTAIATDGARSRAAAAPEYDGPATVFLPRQEDRLVMLLALRENADTPPDCFLLAGFLPDKGQIALTLLPPKTLLLAGEQWGTLVELYQRGGMPYAARLVADYLAIPVERYGMMEVAGLRKLMENAGFFDYYLPVELDYPLHQRQVALSRGPQQLDGRKVADILFYPAYKGGEAERSDRGVMLLTRMVNHHLANSTTPQGDALVKSFLNNCQGNLSWQDYEERRQATEFLSRLELPAASAVYVEGSQSRDNRYVLLSDSCRARLCRVFGGQGWPPTAQGGDTQVRLGAYDRLPEEEKPME